MTVDEYHARDRSVLTGLVSVSLKAGAAGLAPRSWHTDLHTTTFERSRDFRVDRVTPAVLHLIAERIRRRYHQQAVLTFEYRSRPSEAADAVEVEVRGLSTRRLRDGLLNDAQARERLSGGSVTTDGRLVLIAARQDLAIVRRLVTEIGGNYKAATLRFGHREFAS